ncbi:TadE/TadG family type IV pilus assembly protein [Brachybacterium sp. YJGR34]|uniref:TadE/TadG family type IV pilus assembly protein n=1 Tax=Brachybacterium sp. YJGR34 TaxID=2059911 RepID=UPI000E0A5A5D|nr:TadE family protein [Brachybacterium sp. YJGR34]
MSTPERSHFGAAVRGDGAQRARSWRSWARRLRSERGSAVAEFPMVAVLIVMIGLMVVQAALIVHTRNTLVDAAVQGAHHAALVGSSPQDGASRAEQLIGERFGDGLAADATAVEDEDGTIRVRVTATLPLVGLLGPSGVMSVEGRALDEESW